MNEQLLNEFTQYCKAHPDVPFWRAILGWVQTKHDANFEQVLIRKGNKVYDTVNWDGTDSPMVLFKDVAIEITGEK